MVPVSMETALGVVLKVPVKKGPFGIHFLQGES